MKVKRERVTEWPAYVLNNVPRKLRLALTADAAARNRSVQDSARAALCAHYGLDCPQVSYRYDISRDEGSQRMILRMDPALYKRIRRDSRNGRSSRDVILNVLTTHFGGNDGD